MTFKYKLSRRLALLKNRRAVSLAVVLAAAVANCERPVQLTDVVGGLAALVVVPSTVSLAENQATDFVAFGLTAAGDTIPVAVSWSVTGGNITDSTGSQGVHYGHYQAGPQAGRFQVVASDPTNGMADTATAVVTATVVPIAAVVVLPASASAPVGGSVQFVAVPLDSTGTALGGRVIAWASSNTSVASVNDGGLATGLAAGSATISATSEGHSGTAACTVSAVTVPVASVTVSPPSAAVAAGQTVQLTATPKDASGNALTGRTITWTSGTPSVATVSTGGLVRGVAAGSATITATSEGKSGTSAVTVTAPAADGYVPEPGRLPRDPERAPHVDLRNRESRRHRQGRCDDRAVPGRSGDQRPGARGRRRRYLLVGGRGSGAVPAVDLVEHDARQVRHDSGQRQQREWDPDPERHHLLLRRRDQLRRAERRQLG